jgi:hypothetical protein
VGVLGTSDGDMEISNQVLTGSVCSAATVGAVSALGLLVLLVGAQSILDLVDDARHDEVLLIVGSMKKVWVRVEEVIRFGYQMKMV